MTGPLRIGVAGLGTVGVGTVRLLAEHADLLAQRCGRRLEVAAVSARERNRDRGVDVSEARWYDDAQGLAADADIDVVVELIGGADGVALDLCRAAIKAGKHVVTANKALIAGHGSELAALAESAGVALGYEAAVGGGIPIVKALREGLAANRVDRVYGILNGTCNYILSAMRESGRDFAEVLAEAQRLGYAEADPGFDIDGVDSAHKLAILASLAFGCRLDFDAVHIEGIRHVSPLDIDYALELGYHIKLLGIAGLTERGLEQRVHPCMVSVDVPIAHVDGVFNAVVAEGDFVDRTMFSGRGAGAGPTASAVVADLVDIARNRILPVFGIPAGELADIPAASMENHFGAYYIRLMVVDRPGVMADVTAALRDAEVSVEALIQRGRNPGDVVPVVLTTHETEERAMRQALSRIGELDTVLEAPHMIRIEQL
ncbi:MAG: homoserine dehydrogenase [Proteobacteria bacterium]|nr:homoserine dehydrogenase [Pseudomonadota bacterium]